MSIFCHFSPSLEAGYRPNSVYSTHYRNQTYPTLSSRSQSQIGSQSDFDKSGGSMRLEGSLDSGFSSTNNMYNVNSRRTSRYESNQDLNSTGESHYETLDNVFDNRLTFQPKQNNVDGSFRKMQNYGSLERNLKKRNNREYERKHSDTDTNNDNAPSRFGKRTSQSEYDLSSKGRENLVGSSESDFSLPPRYGYSRNVNAFGPSRMDRLSERSESSASSRMIELPVTHTSVTPKHKGDGDTFRDLEFHTHSRTAWQDTADTEPSPMVRSPTKKINNEFANLGGEDQAGLCYSPRDYEGSRGPPPPKPPHTEHSVKYMDSTPPVPQPQSSKIVTVAKMSPSVEVSKPFEMKDFYKYSEKLRRQRMVEQYHQALVGHRQSASSQHSSESDGHSSLYHSYQNRGTPKNQFHGSSSSSPFGSPVSSRHMPVNHPYSSQNQMPSENVGFTGERTNVTSSTTSSYEHGVSTTTSRIQYTVQSQSGRVLYKAQHQTSRHTHYTPPTSMKCEPVKPVKSSNLQDTSTSSR